MIQPLIPSLHHYKIRLMNNNKMKKMPAAIAAMTSLDNFSKLLVL